MKKHHILFLLLISAFAIRIWGIWNVSAQDEYNEVIEALRVCSGHFNFERWIKRFYLYILAFQYGLYYAAGWIFNIFQSPMDFAEKIIRNIEPLFLMGRVTSVLAGTATVALLYKLGETFFTPRVAILAGVLLVFSDFHIDLSQQAKVDALLGFLVVVTFYFILRILSSPITKRSDFAWCGFFMALSIQTKVNSIALVVPFLIMLFLIWRETSRKKEMLGYFSFCFIIGFILGNPAILIAPHKYVMNMFSYGHKVYTTPVNVIPSDVIGFVAYPLFYYKSMGVLISLLTVISLIYVITKATKQRVVVLSFVIAFYLMMGSLRSLVAPYYMIPVTPFLFLFVGEFLDASIPRVQSILGHVPQKTVTAMISLLIAAALWTPIVNVGYHVLSLSGPNTRYLAKDWVEENVPPASRILMDSGRAINSAAPPIAENRTSMERTIRNAKENIRQGKIVHEMVDQSALVYYELLLKTVPEKSYDITSTMFGMQVETIDYYLAEGYQYFIISGDRKERRTGSYAKENMPDIARFYASLDTDSRVHLIHVIGPTLKNRGDTFYIYKLKS